jgi:superfamily II DNA/RNA helicase
LIGWKKPTPIQAKAIPVALSGEDIIGLAETGSGKTAAFALPVLHHMLRAEGKKGIYCLVLAPTRCVRRAVNAAVHATIVFCEIC